MCRVTNHQTRLPRATSSLTLNASRDGASTTSLGNLFRCDTTLCVKNFLLISNLNLPCLSLKTHCPITIHPHKQPFPLLFIHFLQVLEGRNEVSPEPPLLQRYRLFGKVCKSCQTAFKLPLHGTEAPAELNTSNRTAFLCDTSKPLTQKFYTSVSQHWRNIWAFTTLFASETAHRHTGTQSY